MLAIQEFEAETVVPPLLIFISCHVNFLKLLLEIYHILKGFERQELTFLSRLKSYTYTMGLKKCGLPVSLSFNFIFQSLGALERNKNIRLDEN